MTTKKHLLLPILLFGQFLLAQNKSAIPLNEVIVSDNQLKNFSSTQSVLKITDSIISKNQSSLSSLLNYNTAIYFKENGLGMVSSPSFRGTTAQQTAVVWNGININSQLLGQTDFNTISTRGYNSIDVKAGGGSVVYGSGAIGGTIHLNNDLKFKKDFNNNFEVYYGDFNTLSAVYGVKFGSNRWSSNASFTRNSSDNDFRFIGEEGKNTNGQYYNYNFSTATGFKIDSRNTLKFYSEFYDGERHFSITSPYAVRTKYQDFNSRNLLAWTNTLEKTVSNIKLAYITEHYNYYEDIENDNTSSGGVRSLIAKYDFVYELASNSSLNAILDYTNSKGASSGIDSENREIAGLSILLKQNISDSWKYDISARQEISNVYKSPLLFSIGSLIDFSDFYKLKFNISRNYRTPTFNDLYWQESGNLDLKPENSYQAEMGNQFVYTDFSITATVFTSKIDDMIRWLPTNNGNWSPINTDKVSIYGLECLLSWKKNFGAHNFHINSTYSYTVSLDDKNNKQLFYVPYHKLTGSCSYSYKRITSYYQFLFVGEVFTTSDNDPKNILSDYNLSNVGLDYNFSKKNIFKVGAKIANLYNEKYESLPSRFMPGRNLTLYLTLNY
ncbi:outer membrane cobalamin receptor [Flavobacterium sp. PL11]|uniref:TonB-dependent receptor plug domain-containing protein n=1 Tax=Flavobacterium sp. PL11 TaxID=3071717 RepID=UPI002DFD3E5E|nr:outer membrane cobalamin receptor [Flavobacterium sp. PL11]